MRWASKSSSSRGPAASIGTAPRHQFAATPNEIDRRYLDGEVIQRGSMSGTRLEIAARLRHLEEAGALAVMYQPGGPDIERELRAFQEAAQLRHELPPRRAEDLKSTEHQHA